RGQLYLRSGGAAGGALGLSGGHTGGDSSGPATAITTPTMLRRSPPTSMPRPASKRGGGSSLENAERVTPRPVNDVAAPRTAESVPSVLDHMVRSYRSRIR